MEIKLDLDWECSIGWRWIGKWSKKRWKKGPERKKDTPQKGCAGKMIHLKGNPFFSMATFDRSPMDELLFNKSLILEGTGTYLVESLSTCGAIRSNVSSIELLWIISWKRPWIFFHSFRKLTFIPEKYPVIAWWRMVIFLKSKANIVKKHSF